MVRIPTLVLFNLPMSRKCRVVTGEIFPLQIRAKAMSMSTASNWFAGFFENDLIYMLTESLLGSGISQLDTRVSDSVL